MIRLTKHAEQRMREMRVSKDDVINCLNNPEILYGSNERSYTAQKGNIAVAYWIGNEGGFKVKIVATVLWRIKERYERG